MTVFKAPDYKPPREIAQLSGDFARMAGKHADLLSPDAIADYFREVYWRKGDGLDRRADPGTSFAERRGARRRFRLPHRRGQIPHDRERHGAGDHRARGGAKEALAKLAFDGAARRAVWRERFNPISCRCRRRRAQSCSRLST